MSKDISIIIPIFNEEGNIINLWHELKEVMDKMKKKYEVIYINDGSFDASEKIIKKLAKKNKEIHLISFVRNFGQTAAWSAGFDHAKGNYLITMDGDGQNDPHDIPIMFKLMKEKNADVITGWRKNRQDPFLRSIMSKIANKFVNWITKSKIRDSGCSLRIIKKSIVKSLSLYGEMHRLLPFLLSGYGAKIYETPVRHHPRIFGESKYGFSRTFKVLLDVLVVKFLITYQTKPIYLFGIVGFIQIGFAIVSGIFILIRAYVWGGDLISPLFAVSAVAFAYGVISIFLGLMAEIQVRTWYEGSGKKSYEIKKQAN